MPHLSSYDSLDDMMNAMNAAEDAANARTHPEQRAISFGDYWMRPYDEIMLFGHVQDLDELVASELLGITRYDRQSHPTAVGRAHRLLADSFGDVDPLTAWLLGDTDPQLEELVDGSLRQLLANAETDDETWEEFTGTLTMLRDSNRRGYRFGTVWSLIVPDGELGSTHVSEIMPSSKAEFEDARAVGWDFRALVTSGCLWARQLIATASRDPEAAYRRKP